MIEVDISHIWGSLSLPELLAEEKDIFEAHQQLADAMPGGMGAMEEPEIQRILDLAEKIRTESDACVVIGGGPAALEAQGAVTLLQGADRNLGKGKGEPQIFYAGNSFSTRQWNTLQQHLEGKDFRVVAVDDGHHCVESALALRNIRWLLERRYGTDAALSRMYGVAYPDSGLYRLAQQQGWECIELPDSGSSAVTAAALLPMAIAGLDIREILRGVRKAWEQYDLRSFENPAWLHAGVRNALYHKGKTAEVLSYWEPDMAGFGRWWQQLFAQTAGRAEQGLLPVTMELPGEQNAMGLLIRRGCRDVMETMVFFAPPELGCTIVTDVQNADGLNPLAGKDLSFVDEQCRQVMLDDREELGLPVITMDCGKLDPEKVGEMFGFFRISSGISGYALNHECAFQENGGKPLFCAMGCGGGDSSVIAE